MERTPPTNPTPSNGEQPPSPRERLTHLPDPRLLHAAFDEKSPEALGRLLTDSLRDAVVEALALGEQLDDKAARLIAFALEAFADEVHEPTLERFFHDGVGSHAELRDIYAPLFAPGRVAAEFAVLLDTLGTDLFHRERPQTAPPFPQVMEGSMVYFDTLPDGRRVGIGFAAPSKFGPVAFENVARNLTDLIGIHGDAFRAWLRLPGVDVLDTYLVEQFQARTLGPVTGADSQPLTEEEIAAGVDWDAVEVDGILHAFRIPTGAERRDA